MPRMVRVCFSKKLFWSVVVSESPRSDAFISARCSMFIGLRCVLIILSICEVLFYVLVFKSV